MGFSDYLFSNYDPKLGRRFFQDPTKQAKYDEAWKRNKSCRVSDSVADDLALAEMVLGSEPRDTKSVEIQRIQQDNERYRDELESLAEETTALESKFDAQIDEIRDEHEERVEELERLLAESQRQLQAIAEQVRIANMTPDERHEYEAEQTKIALTKVATLHENLDIFEAKMFEEIEAEKNERIRRAQIKAAQEEYKRQESEKAAAEAAIEETKVAEKRKPWWKLF